MVIASREAIAREPVGNTLIAVITFAAPALAAGNTVVSKGIYSLLGPGRGALLEGLNVAAPPRGP